MSAQTPHTSPVLLKQWDAEARQHEKRVYFNKPQLMAQYIGAKTTVIVAGRRYLSPDIMGYIPSELIAK